MPHVESETKASTYANKFSGRYEHRAIKGGVGHNLPQEAPQAFAKAIVEVDGFLIDAGPFLTCCSGATSTVTAIGAGA